MKRARIFGGGRHRRGVAGETSESASSVDSAAVTGTTEEKARRPGGTSAPPLWTDSHCHMQSSDDLHGVLERGRQSGARRMVFVGTDEASSREGASVAAALSGTGAPPVEIWSTVGLHPHDASSGVGGVGRFLRELYSAGLSTSRVVAVGECGLDYHYDHSPRAAQRDAFAAQIAFAQQFSLALVIHTREAWDDTLAIIDREGVPPRLIFHCFTGGPGEAQACLDRGGYLSFSGIVTFATASAVREAATMCPLDRLLVETDAPFLTPVPHRGKPNEPSYVPIIGAQIATLKGLDDTAIAQATTSNAAVVFDLHG
ncbi:MAG: TatD family hydrolase [Acidimicrobiales bacterium]|jgi:TatD DNase family protein